MKRLMDPSFLVRFLNDAVAKGILPGATYIIGHGAEVIRGMSSVDRGRGGELGSIIYFSVSAIYLHGKGMPSSWVCELS